jgi:hypothetical protein
MSLRTQIRNAVDDVAYPPPDLERRVTAFVLANNRDRKVLPSRRRSGWSRQLRGSMALVAALLVVALVGGLIVGGRLLRDLWTAPQPSINHTELKRLEARALAVLPGMPSSGECPVGPLSDDFIGNPAVGDGPMRLHVGMPSTYNSEWGTWNVSYFVVAPTMNGLFVVRARDLGSRQSVFFAANLSGVADAQMGRSLFAGKVAGHDRVNGQDVPRYPELVIDASAPSDWAKTTYKAPQWGAYVGYPKGASGCIFFQVDYGDTTETFVYGY